MIQIITEVLCFITSEELLICQLAFKSVEGV